MDKYDRPRLSTRQLMRMLTHSVKKCPILNGCKTLAIYSSMLSLWKRQLTNINSRVIVLDYAREINQGSGVR